MFGFGILMTGLLWLYWELYTRPFRPLQSAIVEAFPDSSPRVVGGQHKSHRGLHPRLLRIVVRVEFDPHGAADDVIEHYRSTLAQLAEAHVDLSVYDTLEIHLVHRVPEGETQQRKLTLSLDDAETSR